MASPELEATIAMLRQLDLVTGDIEADRAVMAATTEVPLGIPHERVTVADRAAAWITAGERADAAMLYLHGGGYVMGGISTHAPFAARLSADTGLPVLLLDYRLAPEHHHPAALDDALAAVEWLISRGIESTGIVVAGDSAGGGLTLATLVALREQGVRAAAGVALSPWADLTCTNPSHTELAETDPLVKPDALRLYAESYAGTTPVADPRLSPALGDLSDLPPVLVQVGGNEILLDDSVAVVDAITASGGEATLQKWDEGVHVFQMLGAPESDEAIASIVAFLADRV